MNGAQCKLARVALGWGVRELARIAGVSTQTVSRLERGEPLKDNTVATIKLVFEEAGIEFLAENENGYGIWVNKRR